MPDLHQTEPSPGACLSLTWPVQELALAHVSDVQALEQQHQVAQVVLHHAGAARRRHVLLIQRLGVHTDAQTCHRGQREGGN